eukprot:6553377-Pyramimonas_sp.AAC.1
MGYLVKGDPAEPQPGRGRHGSSSGGIEDQLPQQCSQASGSATLRPWDHCEIRRAAHAGLGQDIALARDKNAPGGRGDGGGAGRAFHAPAR